MWWLRFILLPLYGCLVGCGLCACCSLLASGGVQAISEKLPNLSLPRRNLPPPAFSDINPPKVVENEKQMSTPRMVTENDIEMSTPPPVDVVVPPADVVVPPVDVVVAAPDANVDAPPARLNASITHDDHADAPAEDGKPADVASR